MCRRLLRVAVGRRRDSRRRRLQIRLQPTSCLLPSITSDSTSSDSTSCVPSRSSRASGVRSGSMTSSASAASRRRCATRSPPSASRSRSSSPARAASARRRPRASWRAALNCEHGTDRRSLRRLRRLRRDRRRAATWTSSRSTPPPTRRSTRSARSSSPASASAPVRDRYKIFIIDEVHRLSPQAFDALLKSIEEPPPHVVFMMATTEIDKVPPTIQSRSQVFELKTIGVKQIADQLQTIADAEQIAIDDAALMLIARAGDGSMRDAQSAFDQVIAFAGTTITAEDVATVLGPGAARPADRHRRRRRARGRRRRVFELAGRAVETGYDLRHVVRELARLTRDLLRRRHRSVARSTIRRSPPKASGSGCTALVGAVLARGPDARVRRADEGGVRDPRLDAAALPPRDGAAALDPPAQAGAADRSRFSGLEKGGAAARRRAGAAARRAAAAGRAERADVGVERRDRRAPPVRDRGRRSEARRRPPPRRPPASRRRPTSTTAPALPAVQPVAARSLKDAFLGGDPKAKKFFYGTVIAQAQRIDVEATRRLHVRARSTARCKRSSSRAAPWLEDDRRRSSPAGR